MPPHPIKAVPRSSLFKTFHRLTLFSHSAKYSLVVNNTQRSPALFREHAKIMKALAHPTRMFIVDELSRGERCVCELTDMIGVEMPTVSRHLSLLKKAGLVDDEKRGLKIFYRLRVPCCLSFLECVDSVLNADQKKPTTCSGGKSCAGEKAMTARGCSS